MERKGSVIEASMAQLCYSFAVANVRAAAMVPAQKG
jgi:hypothetical protein